MIVAATLVASVLYYYKKYDPKLVKCTTRPETTAMKIWTFGTELVFSLLGPIATLVLNALVIVGVRNARRARRTRELEMSNCRGGARQPDATPGRSAAAEATASVGRRTAEGASRNSKSPSHQKTPTKTVTTATLLTISFFYVITTLPATLLHLTFRQFEIGNGTMTDEEIAVDPDWTRYFAFRQLEIIVYELSVPHYVINLFIFLPTGRHFREAIVDALMCRRSAAVVTSL